VEVVLERRLLGDLIVFDSELLGQDFLDPLVDLFARRCHVTSIVWGFGGWLKTGRSYTDTFRKPIREPFDDSVLGASCREPDRVGDCRWAARPVRDHGKSTQAEKVGATVGVGVEPRPQASRGRSDQRAAELAAGRCRDLLAERVQELLDRSFKQLQRDVAGEA